MPILAVLTLALTLTWSAHSTGYAQTYDLLLKGGHVIDPRNNLNGSYDVAVAGRQIARVDRDIPARYMEGSPYH